MRDVVILREEWDALAATTANVFATWEFVSTWLHHFGEGRPLLVEPRRGPDGRLVAILPLYLWRARPLKVARFLGHDVGDQLGPIHSPDARSEAVDGLRALLADGRCDVLVGERLPGEERWAATLAATPLAREASPVLRFETRSWDDHLASRSSNFRQQVRRRERTLAREHAVRFRLADDGERLQHDLDTLFALHASRWGGGDTTFARSEAFHREFAARAFARGWLRLWFLEIDGRARAAWYGFRFGGAEAYYQSGRDRQWDERHVGFVLLVHTIRQALEEGMREYKFLRGDEPYKYRFASDDPGLETIALAQTILGRAAVATAAALPRKLLRSATGSRSPERVAPEAAP